MRRTGLIILTSFYMLITSGLVVNLHYCGDFISEIAVMLDADNCCCEEEDAEPSSCCDEDSISFDVEDDHLASFVSLKFKALDNVFTSFNFNFNEIKGNDVQVVVNHANAPPKKKRKPYILFKQLKVFG